MTVGLYAAVVFIATTLVQNPAVRLLYSHFAVCCSYTET